MNPDLFIQLMRSISRLEGIGCALLSALPEDTPMILPKGYRMVRKPFSEDEPWRLYHIAKPGAPPRTLYMGKNLLELMDHWMEDCVVQYMKEAEHD